MSTLKKLRVLTQGEGDGYVQAATLPEHAIRKQEFDEAIEELEDTSHAALTRVDTQSIELVLDAQELKANLRRKITGRTSSQGLLGQDENGVFVSLGSDSGSAAPGDHSHANATELADGFMSKEDKALLQSLSPDVGLSTSKVAFTIGNGVAKIFNINHMLNTVDVVVSVRKLTGDKAFLSTDIRGVDGNNIILEFYDAPDSGTMRVTVIG